MRPHLVSLSEKKREKHTFEFWLRDAHIKTLEATAHMLFQLIIFFVLSFRLTSAFFGGTRSRYMPILIFWHIGAQ